MKKFLLADRTQAWICTILGAYIVASIFSMLIMPNIRVGLAASCLISIVVFLAYNVWVSDQLNRHE